MAAPLSPELLSWQEDINTIASESCPWLHVTSLTSTELYSLLSSLWSPVHTDHCHNLLVLTTGLLQVYHFSMPCLCSSQVLKKKLYCSCNTLDSGYSVRSSQALTLTSLSDIFTLGSHCFTELCMGKGSREHRSLLSNSPKLFKIIIVFPHFWGST